MIQRILRLKIALKLEFFLLRLMDNEFEKIHGKLIPYMVSAQRLLQQWKNNEIPTVQEWIVQILDSAKMENWPVCSENK